METEREEEEAEWVEVTEKITVFVLDLLSAYEVCSFGDGTFNLD